MNIASIVTGGGTGIGRAIVFKLAETTNVILVGRKPEPLESTCEEINSQRNLGRADFILGDVTNPETAKRATQLAERSNWEIRNLITNAGIGGGGYSTAEFDELRWQEVVDINLNGSFYFIKACLPSMVKNK